MLNIRDALSSLAGHLNSRRAEILRAWEAAVRTDPGLKVGFSLSRVDFLDHVPALLDTFESELKGFDSEMSPETLHQFHQSAASHGIKRWQQGYDLGELVRELGRLNECLVDEIDSYTRSKPDTSHDAISAARRIWAHFTTVGIDQSVQQYAALQRQEAKGQMHDLEVALAELKTLETRRADLWQQAAHDLRGNVGVVANASVGLTHSTLAQSSRDNFVRILIRGVSSLHQLLDDVTQLARLQAGRESRRLENIDVTPLMRDLCEGIRPVAEQKKLSLQCQGSAGLGVQADPVKVRRIAQNLILNAVKFTQTGGISVTWGDSDVEDAKHWVLAITDTGVGFPSESGGPIASALESEQLMLGKVAPSASRQSLLPSSTLSSLKIIDDGAGEGLGLSIVKRLCELLDATIERHSVPGAGTTFRIRFPKSYPT